jgi:peptidoglycan/LPS O-acetylase OafA/YrhL
MGARSTAEQAGRDSGTTRSASPAAPSAPRAQIVAHTGLRGIAALLVVAYHQQFGDFYRLPFELSTSLFKRSYLMVDLFFILSGFIISYVYRAEGSGMRTSVKSFLFARFARIYPLHFVISIYMLAFAFVSAGLLALVGHAYTPPDAKSLGQWALQLVLVQAWIPGFEAWNIPSWSISAEMFAYALFPAIIFLGDLRPRLVRAALLAVAVGFYIYDTATTGSLDIVAGLAPLRCIAGFAIGMLLYDCRALAARTPDGLLSAAQLIAVAWIGWGLTHRVADPLVVPAFALIVAATWTDRGIIARLLSLRPFERLGEISYSVYLAHVPVGMTVWFFWLRAESKLGLAPPLARAIWLVLVFASVLSVASLTYRYIEVPARKALTRRSRRAPAAPAASYAAAP